MPWPSGNYAVLAIAARMPSSVLCRVDADNRGGSCCKPRLRRLFSGSLAMKQAHWDRLLKTFQIEVYLHSFETGHQERSFELSEAWFCNEAVLDRFGALRL